MVGAAKSGGGFRRFFGSAPCGIIIRLPGKEEFGTSTFPDRDVRYEAWTVRLQMIGKAPRSSHTLCFQEVQP